MNKIRIHSGRRLKIFHTCGGALRRLSEGVADFIRVADGDVREMIASEGGNGGSKSATSIAVKAVLNAEMSSSEAEAWA